MSDIQNHDHIRNPIVCVRFVFGGWADDERRAVVKSHLSLLVEEAQAGRMQPTLRGLGICLVDVDEQEDGPPIGSIVEVWYEKKYCDPSLIEEWFRAAGIAVSPAIPFFKEQKSVWQIVSKSLLCLFKWCIPRNK